MKPAITPSGATGETAIRRVTREACTLGGAGRAILLQVAHPAVGRGVAEHSRFTQDPLARLRGTLAFVYGVTFGTPEEVEWVAGLVARIHERVVGVGYSADDPELQVWVAATLYQSALQMYEISFGPMPAAMKDEFCRQGALMATALGCPAELWPGTVAEFEDYWTRQVAALEIGDDARRICRELMYSRTLPWYLRPVLPVSRLMTAGLLPEPVREAYGLAWDPWRARVFGAGVRVTRLTYRYVPRTLRGLPMAYYLRGFRRQFRRSAAAAGTGGGGPSQASAAS